MSASEILQTLAAGSLGVLVGALIAEGALLVPYWRSLTSAEFYRLHKHYGPRLFRFYAPLTVGALALPLFAAVAVRTGPSVVAAGLALCMGAIYSVFFRGANEAFAREAVTPEDLPAALARWSRWHWGRVSVGVVAFSASLLALVR